MVRFQMSPFSNDDLGFISNGSVVKCFYENAKSKTDSFSSVVVQYIIQVDAAPNATWVKTY